LFHIPPISRPFVLLNWELLQIIFPSLKKKTKVIALMDGLESHIKWIKDIEETQNVTLNTQLLQTKVSRKSL
jgi:hypothetical protein